MKNESGKIIRSRKRKDLLSFAGLVVIILMINFIASYFFQRFDLTSEKRYTLNPSTKEMLSNLSDGVYIKVYLEGDFNPSFTRLKNETKEMLDQFRNYSKKEFNYEFVNIYESGNQKDVENLQRQLYSKGLAPTELNIKTNAGNKTQIIFPGALVTYKGRESVWQIFRQQIGVPSEVCINNSVQGLEYELANTIRKLDIPVKPKVAFIQGHYELDTLFSYDFQNSLKEYYDVDYVTINHQLKALNNYKAIIIAKPDSAFDEKDIFIIDQFIMKGGRVLWCVDNMDINMDSLRLKGLSLGFSAHKGIDEMLFSYGVRINNDLVLDLQSTQIPVNMGFKGSPNFQLKPWYYTPLSLPQSKHPIVKNLDLIRFEYASSIDTVSTKGITKTVLLSSSRNAKIQTSPARISLAMAVMRLKENAFNKAYVPLAVLLEGKFTSVYKNRLTSAFSSDSLIKYKAEGLDSKMIVIGDGDIIKNDYQFATKAVYPLGYDKYMKTTYANKTFLLNCMNYLCDGEKLMNLRSREVKLRLLDKKKVAQSSSKWKWINVGLPLLLIILLGVLATRLRKMVYTKKY